jgi:hypothetical protein
MAKHFIELGYNLESPPASYEIMDRSQARILNLTWTNPTDSKGLPFGGIRLEGRKKDIKRWLEWSGYCKSHNEFDWDTYKEICKEIQPIK